VLPSCTIVLDFLHMENLEAVLTTEEENLLRFSNWIIMIRGSTEPFKLRMGRKFLQKVKTCKGVGLV